MEEILWDKGSEDMNSILDKNLSVVSKSVNQPII